MGVAWKIIDSGFEAWWTANDRLWRLQTNFEIGSSKCKVSFTYANYFYKFLTCQVFYFRPYFSSTVFAKLQEEDPHGRISILHFFNYIMRKIWLKQTRIALSLYDVTGQGFLKEIVCDFNTLWKIVYQISAFTCLRILKIIFKNSFQHYLR